MMEEIMNNGPIVSSFEPAYDFMFYKRGVYHSSDEDSWVFAKEAKPEWEKVDHSVLMYGWGEENGEKYWEL
jgi:cathepsin C